MRKTYIGELEEVVLLTVAILQEEAYGVSITQYIDTELDRKISGGLKSINKVDPAAVKRALDEKGIEFSDNEFSELQNLSKEIEAEGGVETISRRLQTNIEKIEVSLIVFGTFQWGYGNKFHCFWHGFGWTACS